MKKLKIILIILVIIVFIFILLQILPAKKAISNNPWVISKGERPFVIVHGGAKELYPENTILAFEEITKMDIDAIEIDLALTKDNILITHHDLTIDRMSNGKGRVRDYDYLELLQFDFAYNFSYSEGSYPYRSNEKAKPETLHDLFSKYGDYKYIIEIKDLGEDGKIASEELYKIIKDYKMINKSIIASFDDDNLEYLRKISNGELMLSTAVNEATKFVILEKLRLGIFYFPKSIAFQLPIKEKAMGIDMALDTKHLIDEVNRHNMCIHYWTINDKDEMKRLINLGVDGIITDRPDIMIDLLKELGYSKSK